MLGEKPAVCIDGKLDPVEEEALLSARLLLLLFLSKFCCCLSLKLLLLLLLLPEMEASSWTFFSTTNILSAVFILGIGRGFSWVCERVVTCSRNALSFWLIPRNSLSFKRQDRKLRALPSCKRTYDDTNETSPPLILTSPAGKMIIRRHGQAEKNGKRAKAKKRSEHDGAW